MKKLQLTISEPCHEKWSEMAPQDKGRFCGSCQKTVVDFSQMSDRQVAEFFKKPPASVCGRFHNDQLNRAFDIPKKRIPWLRYFFQFTWPAFVFFLKSCTEKNRTTGKIHVNEIVKTEMIENSGTVGMTFSQWSYDTSTVSCVFPETIVEKNIVVGAVDWLPLPVENIEGLPIVVDSLVREVPEADSDDFALNVDTIEVNSQGTVFGDVKAVTMDSAAMNLAEKQKPAVDANPKISVYPNPVKAGSVLTIDLRNVDFPTQIEILSMNGQVVFSFRKERDKDESLNMLVPEVADGIYVVRLVTKNKTAQSAKIVITH